MNSLHPVPHGFPKSWGGRDLVPMPCRVKWILGTRWPWLQELARDLPHTEQGCSELPSPPSALPCSLLPVGAAAIRFYSCFNEFLPYPHSSNLVKNSSSIRVKNPSLARLRFYLKHREGPSHMQRPDNSTVLKLWWKNMLYEQLGRKPSQICEKSILSHKDPY